MSELRTKRSFLAAALLFLIAALACILFVHSKPTVAGSAWAAAGLAEHEGFAMTTAEGSDGTSPTTARESGSRLQPYRMLPWLLTLMPQQRAEAAQVPARGTALRGGAPAASVAMRPYAASMQSPYAPVKPQTDATQYMPNPALLARSNAKFWSGMADAAAEAQGREPLSPAQRQDIQSTLSFVDRRKPETLD